MLIVIELIIILILVTYIGFSTTEEGVVYILDGRIEPVVLSLVFMLVGIFITLPIFFKNKMRQMQDSKKINKEKKALKNELESEKKLLKYEHKHQKEADQKEVDQKEADQKEAEKSEKKT